jgi:hypothetical protein
MATERRRAPHTPPLVQLSFRASLTATPVPREFVAGLDELVILVVQEKPTAGLGLKLEAKIQERALCLSVHQLNGELSF